MTSSQNYSETIHIKKVSDYSEQEMIECLLRDIRYKKQELIYIQKNLIAEYIKFIRSVFLVVWCLLTTKYMYNYLRKLLAKYFFLLLKLMFYMSLLFLLMGLLGALEFGIYPLNIITDYCFDTFIEWSLSI